MHRILRRLGLGVVVVLGTTACWPQLGYDANRTNYNSFEDTITADTVTDLGVSWTYDMPEGQGMSAPVASQYGVHFTMNGPDGPVLVTLASDSGDLLWSTNYAPAGHETAGLPVVRGDEIVATSVYHTIMDDDSDHGSTVRLDAETGDVIGHVSDDGGRIYGLRDDSIVRYNRVAIFSSLTGWDWIDIDAVEGNDSRRMILHYWTEETMNDPLGFDDLVVGDGLIFYSGVGLLEDSEGAYSRFGQGFRAISRDPVDNSCSHPSHADVSMDCPVWAVEGAQGAPAIHPSQDFVYLNNVAYDAATGDELWTGSLIDDYLAPSDRLASRPAIANGQVYIATDDGLRVYNEDGCGQPECDPVWVGGECRFEDADGIIIDYCPRRSEYPPVVTDDLVFIRSRSRVPAEERILAYNAAGCGTTICDPVWESPVLEFAESEEGEEGMVVSNGRLYVMTIEGLTAFSLNDS